MNRILESAQKLGGALMLPIAVLPVAGLLLRLGQPDLLNVAPIAAAGDAIFSNLGLLFAVGIAVGLARENHGAAGLAGLVGFFVATKGAEVLIGVPPDLVANLTGAAKDAAAQAYKAKSLSKLSVPIGILSGLLAGWLYNRYANIKLPPYLAFFGGRRFVPIAAGGAGLVLAFVFGYGWPAVEAAMDTVSRAVISSGEIGLFVYGVLNRLLIVTGLHHILNNVAWFIVGDYNGATGDLKRFFAGDPSAGAFMSGFFPVMMFGLPAACYAMYRTAAPDRKRDVGGLMASMALTSFLTGVTEPIEFTFMFLAPWLYALHALLTGAAMVTMHLLNVHLGFGFSAGLFDYGLNFNKSTHPLVLIPVGLVYSALYYFVFHWCIVRFDLKTPGREGTPAPVAPLATSSGDAAEADAYIRALGGASNLKSVDACATRLRLELGDRDVIDAEMLKGLGARGTVRVGSAGLQVVVGPIADLLAGEIRTRLRSSPPSAAGNPDAVLAGLGGRANVKRVECGGGRLLVTVGDAQRVDEKALRDSGARGVALASRESVHVLHPDADALGKRLAAMLAG
jgi:PTS system N-acetylglucosamine-specific IIC component